MKGVIECTNLDTHYVINVEFHDRSSHGNIHFQDLNKFDMASLGMCSATGRFNALSLTSSRRIRSGIRMSARQW
jgi:hypothetical protein